MSTDNGFQNNSLIVVVVVESIQSFPLFITTLQLATTTHYVTRPVGLVDRHV